MLLCCWAKGHAEPLYLVSNMSSAEEAIAYYQKRFRIETFFSDQKSRWCPSIACMKYAQRAHACCPLQSHGTRSTSGVRYGVHHLLQSSGDGGLRSVGRSAEIASRDVHPGRR